jgi:hypothetical protein
MTNLTDLTVDSLTIGGVVLHEDLPDTALISIDMGVVTLSKVGVVTATLAKPTTVTDDHKRLYVVSLTAQAHTLAVVGGSFGNGGAGENLATWDAAIGAGIALVAFGGEWYITNKTGVTVT